MEGEVCILPNCTKKPPLISVGPQRIRSIISASKCREDSIYVQLELQLESCCDLTIQVHKNCVSYYTSKHHIIRVIQKRAHECTHSEPPTRRWRSEVPAFDFRTHCVFCGDECKALDKKNPSRYRTVSQCRTADVPGKDLFEDSLLKRCDERGDNYSYQVRLWVLGAASDLHAADTQYHRDCCHNFMSKRNVQAASNKAYDDCVQDHDNGFLKLTEMMEIKKDSIWSSIELYECYRNFGATAFVEDVSLLVNCWFTLTEILLNWTSKDAPVFWDS